MRVLLLGTGFSVPTPERAQSGILVETPRNLLLFDCGAGILQRIAQSKYDLKDIEHIFFTHHHLDHDSDFLVLLKAAWLKGRKELQIYGPEGTREWLSNLLDAYEYLKGRVKIEVMELKDGSRIEIRGDVVECRLGRHSLPNLAYKITSSASMVMVYSGDTEPCRGVAELCKEGVELLIHECSLLDPVSGQTRDHSSPTALGKLLHELPVNKLVITHFSPETKGREGEMADIIKRYFDGEVIVGKDLLEIEI